MRGEGGRDGERGMKGSGTGMENDWDILRGRILLGTFEIEG